MKYTLIILTLLFSYISFSQENVENYLQQRENLYIQNKDYTSLDRDFSATNGEILPALVKKEIIGQQVIFTYRTFRNINAKNEQHVLLRLKQSVPSIVGITNSGNEIKVSFLNPIAENDLTELLRLTGFKGYKIMNTP